MTGLHRNPPYTVPDGLLDAGWQEQPASSQSPVAILERPWRDTWHPGIA